MTVSAWIKSTESGDDSTIYLKKQTVTDNSGIGYGIGMLSTGKLRAAISEGTANKVITGTKIINDGIWHHVAAVFDRDGNLQGYTDGITDGNPTDISAYSSNSITSSWNADIGNDGNSKHRWNGTIDEVRIYNRSLTAEEVAKHAGIYVHDYSGKGNYGVWHNLSQIGQWNSSGGRFGSAFDFDGVDDYINCSNDASLNFGTSDFTIEVWYKPNTLPDYPNNPDLLTKYQSSTGYALTTVTDRTLLLFTSSNYLYSTSVLSVGEWAHIVYVKSGTTIFKVYINGVDRSGSKAGSTPADIGSPSVDLRIGKGQYYRRSPNGTIDSVRIYNHSLTAQEIRARYWLGHSSGIYLNSSKLGFSMGNSTLYTAITSGWHHVAGTWEPDQAKLYVDGTVKQSKNSDLLLNSALPDHGIGANYGGFQNFNGSIDEVNLYGYTMGANEVRQLFEGYNTTWSEWSGPDYTHCYDEETEILTRREITEEEYKGFEQSRTQNTRQKPDNPHRLLNYCTHKYINIHFSSETVSQAGVAEPGLLRQAYDLVVPTGLHGFETLSESGSPVPGAENCILSTCSGTQEGYCQEDGKLYQQQWKSFKDLDEDDLVATLNPETGEMEFQLPTERQIYEYEGEMYKIMGEDFELMVSPEHKVYVAVVEPNPSSSFNSEVDTIGILSPTISLNSGSLDQILTSKPDDLYFKASAVYGKSSKGENSFASSKNAEYSSLGMGSIFLNERNSKYQSLLTSTLEYLSSFSSFLLTSSNMYSGVTNSYSLSLSNLIRSKVNPLLIKEAKILKIKRFSINDESSIHHLTCASTTKNILDYECLLATAALTSLPNSLACSSVSWLSSRMSLAIENCISSRNSESTLSTANPTLFSNPAGTSSFKAISGILISNDIGGRGLNMEPGVHNPYPLSRISRINSVESTSDMRSLSMSLFNSDRDNFLYLLCLNSYIRECSSLSTFSNLSKTNVGSISVTTNNVEDTYLNRKISFGNLNSSTPVDEMKIRTANFDLLKISDFQYTFSLAKISDVYATEGKELYFLDSELNPVRVLEIEKVPYNGRIYDVDVENDIVLVRRRSSDESVNCQAKSGGFWDDRPFGSLTQSEAKCHSKRAIWSGNSNDESMVLGLDFSEIEYPEHYPDDADLVGYWDFDEDDHTTNLTLDGSDYNNTGTCYNYGGQLCNWTPGKVGTGMEFDGSDDNIAVSHDASLNTDPAITVEAWVKPGSFSGGIQNRGIVDKGCPHTFWGSTAADGWTLGFDKNNMKPTIALDGYTSRFTASSTLSTGEWAHIAMTVGGGTLNIYINGNLDKSASASPTNLDTSLDLWIGNVRCSTSREFGGTIDEVAIYSRALNQSEIMRHYERGFKRIRDESAVYTDNNSGHQNFAKFPSDLANVPERIPAADPDLTAEGKHGSALVFDGKDDYLTCYDEQTEVLMRREVSEEELLDELSIQAVYFSPSSSSNSEVVNTLISDCILKCGSLDQTGSLSCFRDKAKKSMSSGSTEICMACSKNFTYSPNGINSISIFSDSMNRRSSS